MLSMFVGLAVFIAFISVAGMGVLFFIQRDKSEFSFSSIFSAYFYLVAVISLLAVFFGLSGMTKALASDVFGRDFSYYTYHETLAIHPKTAGDEMTEEDRAIELKRQEEDLAYEKERIESQYKDDLFSGISTLVVGIIFLIVHVYGWLKLEPAQKRKMSMLYKGYVILQLVIFSIISLVSLPIGISQALRFFLDDGATAGSVNPGEPLSLAIWALPIWLFFIWLTIRTMRHGRASA